MLWERPRLGPLAGESLWCGQRRRCADWCFGVGRWLVSETTHPVRRCPYRGPGALAGGGDAVSKGPHSVRRRQQVERASQEWRSALIDVSGTNRLLFFKSTAPTLNREWW